MPSPTGVKMARITAYLSQELMDQLTAASREAGCSKLEIIRRALVRYISDAIDTGRYP